MDDDGWRTCLRWVVVHPHDPAVLLARRDGVLALPETERPGQVWTADPAEVLPALGELLGADALLLDCLDDHQDPAAGVQRATLLAVPREAPAPAQGMAWVGRAGLAGAGAGDAAGRPGGRGAGARPRRGRGPALGGPRLVRRGRALAALDHGAPRPAPHRPVRQARVWRLSCLLRAPTGDGDVWFKANTTSPLFVNEGVVMGALAGLFPGQVPAPLAVEPERGWMVLADFGEEVGWEAPMEVVEEVTQTYARMQVEATAGLPGVDAATWLSPDEEAGLRAAVPGLQARCAELAGNAVPPVLVHGDLHLSNVARRPGGYLFFDWTDACVAHPFLDLATIRRGTAFVDAADEAELRERLRQAYLPEWASFEPPGRLARAWELAAPLGALRQAVSYRSLATRPPGDPHMAQSTAWWLRQVLAGLA